MTRAIYTVVAFLVYAALTACSPSPVSSSGRDWNDLNYADAACAKGPGKCSNYDDDEDNINSIGKSKK